MFLLIVILPAASLVSAGSSMFLLVVILPAESLVSAGWSMVLLVVMFPAARLVSAGWSMLVVLFPAARLDSAGCTMALLEVIIPAGFFVPAGSYGLCCCHLVSADSIQSYWWNFFYLKELLPHVYREDLLLLRRRMNRYFRLNPDVDVGLDLWRDVNLLCQSLHSDDVEDFWHTQDDWIVSSWKLYPKSSVHVLDLTNGKTVYMFVDQVYPIRATLLERMLRHKLTVPPSYCLDVVVAGNIIQTVQAGLRESYECLASVPIACTARQMVLSSPWFTANKESGSPLQTALVCNSNPLMVARLPKPG
ncbi:hypothetical protein Tco_1297820, partial [Tanacetum coccineum]